MTEPTLAEITAAHDRLEAVGIPSRAVVIGCLARIAELRGIDLADAVTVAVRIRAGDMSAGSRLGLDLRLVDGVTQIRWPGEAEPRYSILLVSDGDGVAGGGVAALLWILVTMFGIERVGEP